MRNRALPNSTNVESAHTALDGLPHLNILYSGSFLAISNHRNRLSCNSLHQCCALLEPRAFHSLCVSPEPCPNSFHQTCTISFDRLANKRAVCRFEPLNQPSFF